MKRRSRAGGEPIKGRRRKTPEPKRRNAPKAVPRSNSSPTTRGDEVARLTRENAGRLSELREWQQQRTATCRSAQRNQPLELRSGQACSTRSWQLARTSLRSRQGRNPPSRWERAATIAAATYRHSPEFVESQKGILFAPGRSGVVGRVLLGRQISSNCTMFLTIRNTPIVSSQERGGFRTILGVPLLREGAPIGAICPSPR